MSSLKPEPTKTSWSDWFDEPLTKGDVAAMVVTCTILWPTLDILLALVKVYLHG